MRLRSYIWCWAQGIRGTDRYRAVADALPAAEARGWTVLDRPARDARSGLSRRWLGLEREGMRLWFDGQVALGGPDVAAAAAEVSRLFDGIAATMPRPVAWVDAPEWETLDTLSRWTTAMLLLDSLARAVEQRPEPTMMEVERCAQWLRSPVRQHLMGRGVREHVLEPWRAYTADLRRRLVGVGEYWASALEIGERIPAGLRPLLKPLAALNTARDEALILAEYGERLDRLERESVRASAEVGVFGTLATLALVPFEAALGPVYLTPIGMAALTYYGGYMVSRLGRSRPNPPRATRPVPAAADIASTVGVLRCKPAAVVVGDRPGAAEFAASAQLWLTLLQHHRRTPNADSVRFTTDPRSLDNRAGVVFGGPLVQPRDRLRARPTCDLVGSYTYGDWRFETVKGERLLTHTEDETAAVIAAAVDRPDLLTVTGFRDTGAVLATRWLQRELIRSTEREGRAWSLFLRRDGRFENVLSGDRGTA